jgi:HEPN domain-containing protein
MFLHQATESFYNCSLMVLTGDKPHDHELERLNYLLCMESNQFIDVFPYSTKEERECFKLLENGYINSRYKFNYFITNEQLEYLAEKIEDLKEITKEICEKEIESLESRN